MQLKLKILQKVTYIARKHINSFFMLQCHGWFVGKQ